MVENQLSCQCINSIGSVISSLEKNEYLLKSDWHVEAQWGEEHF